MKRNLNLAIFWDKSVSLTIGFALMLMVLVGYYISPKDAERDTKYLIGMSIDSEERIDNLIKATFLTLVMENGSELVVSIPKNTPVRLGANVEIMMVKSDSKYQSNQYSFSKYID